MLKIPQYVIYTQSYSYSNLLFMCCFTSKQTRNLYWTMNRTFSKCLLTVKLSMPPWLGVKNFVEWDQSGCRVASSESIQAFHPDLLVAKWKHVFKDNEKTTSNRKDESGRESGRHEFESSVDFYLLSDAAYLHWEYGFITWLSKTKTFLEQEIG